MSSTLDFFDPASSKRILVAESSPQTSRALQDTLTPAGYEVAVARGPKELPQKIRETSPHLLLIDGPAAYDFCANIRADESVRAFLATQRSARRMPILLTNPANANDLAKGLEAGCDDFIKTSESPGALLNTVQSFLSERPRRCTMVNVEHVLTVLSRAGEGMESPTGSHLEQVAAYALLLGHDLDLSFQERELLRKAALFHDVGKIGVQAAILLKKGPLTAEEWGRMRLHPDIGEKICRPLHQEDAVLGAIRHHHERYDGAGYPDGLKGQQIPLFARIVALADAYDAMTSIRPYREKLSPETALTELEDKAGTQFDPNLATAFCSIFRADQSIEPTLTAALAR